MFNHTHSFLLRIENVRAKHFRQNHNTLLKINNFFKKIVTCTRYSVKCTVEPNRPQITIWSMRFPFWINKAADRH